MSSTGNAATLAEAAATAAANGVTAETVSRQGRPVDEVCAVAAERRARLVVPGSNYPGAIEARPYDAPVAA